VGLLGRTGAGKTTTFYMVVGLTRPDSGQVSCRRGHHGACPCTSGAGRHTATSPRRPASSQADRRGERAGDLETRGLPAGEQRPTRGSSSRSSASTGWHASRPTPSRAGRGGGSRSAGPRRGALVHSCSTSRSRASRPAGGARHPEDQSARTPAATGAYGILIRTDHNVRETLKITDRAYILRTAIVFRSGTHP